MARMMARSRLQAERGLHPTHGPTRIPGQKRLVRHDRSRHLVQTMVTSGIHTLRDVAPPSKAPRSLLIQISMEVLHSGSFMTNLQAGMARTRTLSLSRTSN